MLAIVPRDTDTTERQGMAPRLTATIGQLANKPWTKLIDEVEVLVAIKLQPNQGLPGEAQILVRGMNDGALDAHGAHHRATRRSRRRRRVIG